MGQDSITAGLLDVIDDGVFDSVDFGILDGDLHTNLCRPLVDLQLQDFQRVQVRHAVLFVTCNATLYV